MILKHIDKARRPTFAYGMAIVASFQDLPLQEQVVRTAIEIMAHPDPEIAKLGGEMLGEAQIEPRLDQSIKDRVSETVIKPIFDRFGLDYDELRSRWAEADGGFELTYIQDNIAAIIHLEQQRPGISQVLSGPEFGILNFARWPEEMLLAQYDQRDETGREYGLVTAATADRRGMMVFRHGMLTEFYRRINGLGGTVRIYEVDDVEELSTAQAKSTRRYGPAAFSIVVGFDDADGISFNNDYDGSLTAANVQSVFDDQFRRPDPRRKQLEA